MLTIQKFAQFCHCTAQTLRYYDRIDLLKPRKFVESNHYRLYDPEQAVDFFLIKELQRVGFSIREIKVILLENAPIPEKIKERVQDYKAKLAEIEQDLETFEERKMSVENEILAYEQKSQVKIKIFYEGEKLILKIGEQTYSIQLVQNVLLKTLFPFHCVAQRQFYHFYTERQDYARQTISCFSHSTEAYIHSNVPLWYQQHSIH